MGDKLRKPTVVLALVLETVDDIVDREFCRPPDRALIALAESADVGRLIVSDPWRSWPVQVARRRTLKTRQTLSVRGKPVRRISPRRLRRADPLDVPGLEVQFRRYARRVGAAAGLSATDGAALITYDPFVAAFADAPWITRLVYVGQDDFVHGTKRRAWSPAYEEAYRRIRDRCDDIFTISDELSERIAPGRARTLPNGVDAELWAPREVPAANKWTERGPYAVYAGSVEGRVDDSLFAEVLKAVPEVVVVGPCFDPEQRARLEAMDGVTLTGSLGQRELVEVVSAARVGLIPHHDTPMTRAMSPLKMYEYLAAGLPVVATDLPPVAVEGERVLLCRTRDEWAPAVRAALALGPLDAAGRNAVLARVSWGVRLTPLVASATDPR
ncbi:glycosyltransferase [Pengzhenrongella sicca]|uniref:Glycosyltransferase n=1 Tax=Pengzhenrongella sicca TaxID=2819238 RepID=A0A8A4ZCC5_9MICO|nr:glycosyltransferase [Pengzhenrongella sicca]QTE29650.1 glycosyltransferase [Pengzhenrongella sicca]